MGLQDSRSVSSCYMDGSSISAGLASIKTGLDILKALKDAGELAEEAANQYRLAELLGVLTEAKLAFIDAKEEVLEKDREISRLTELMEMRDAMVFESPYCWLVKGDSREGPYCQKCWEHDGKTIHLVDSSTAGKWWCPVCQKNVHDENYTPKAARPPRRASRAIRW